ncbi:MAG: SDR family oxidoreductase [Gammaproteobacteria bacterium]|nr:SDR family oxidoreductase [Gammaproteobacteria bacterium]
MKNIAIITGGAGGMGLATAKVLGSDHHVIICDINQKKLDAAIAELKQHHISCDSVVCDISNRDSVDALFKFATSQGRVGAVIHTAGLSPQMQGPDIIMKVNTLGTINITEAAYEIASDGFALVNVASMAAYLMPGFLIPKRAFAHACSNVDVLLKKALFPCRFMPKGLYRNGLAYSISKSFVIWYSRKNAARFGEKNARTLSVSPGSFDTEMGRLEKVSGSEEMLKKAALKRFGRPEEIAALLAFCASDKASYLTGVDILCDGGVIASKG